MNNITFAQENERGEGRWGFPLFAAAISSRWNELKAES